MTSPSRKPAGAFPITILPVYTGGEFRLARRRTLRNVLESQPSIFLSRGAVAIRLALTAERIGAGDEVLVPAFHCPSMIAPVVSTGATPVFYGITEALGIDLSSVERLISATTRAILAPHFFGRIQDLGALRELCTTEKIVLIEDCAHALTGAEAGPDVGGSGDYVIASPRKFAPVGEGGFLGGRRLQRMALGRPSFKKNFRILFDMADRAIAAGRLPVLRAPVAAMKQLKRSASTAPVASSTQPHGVHLARHPANHPQDDQLAKELLAASEASAAGRFLLGHWDFDRAALVRRENYHRLAAAMSASTRYRVLESPLPLSQAPYMLPLLMTEPARQFAAIKNGPVPVWRWEHSRRDACTVTDWYATALIQVPCHQSLAAAEVSRIADALLDAA